MNPLEVSAGISLATCLWVGVVFWHDSYRRGGVVFLALATAIAISATGVLGFNVWNAIRDVANFFLWIFSIAISG